MNLKKADAAYAAFRRISRLVAKMNEKKNLARYIIVETRVIQAWRSIFEKTFRAYFATMPFLGR